MTEAAKEIWDCSPMILMLSNTTISWITGMRIIRLTWYQLLRLISQPSVSILEQSMTLKFYVDEHGVSGKFALLFICYFPTELVVLLRTFGAQPHLAVEFGGSIVPAKQHHHSSLD